VRQLVLDFGGEAGAQTPIHLPPEIQRQVVALMADMVLAGVRVGQAVAAAGARDDEGHTVAPDEQAGAPGAHSRGPPVATPQLRGMDRGRTSAKSGSAREAQEQCGGVGRSSH
jgi:hypothetical protein